MNQAREQFHRTTEQYFHADHKINPGIKFQPKNQTPAHEIKTFYIKEGPFINYTER